MKNLMMINIEDFLGFFGGVLEELETSELTVETELESLEDWDSLARLGVISLAEERFGLRLDGQRIEGCKTIGELLDYLNSVSA